ncbi:MULTISPECIES: hypothetical protein [unclassified Ensifer]|uniref:hypothetical protein n=1 Tax=unclassified Ensifer TaxID=2633371 RepID=UPI000813BADF|nr:MULTISPECIES: hypothetical protein [unclassified Ensifer]OCP05738.1 hypothetical protein BBX50_04425 [Ensifer sp. LC11]OCP06483.1 hypothetical protein BC374_04485 [Ensifer sp. LC13]OCP06791.1 hypothetical protein BC362_11680 [Ensifer sp. LC14]OCP31278.1 hypothetical protein BC364_05610 [Ensifer sp. LC499]
MKHQTIEQLQALAEIRPDPVMTRTERLQRWAELLEINPGRRLGTLSGTEHASAAVRQTMQVSGSPMTVAFEDTHLRLAGLADDSYGEAKRFFELSDHQLHDIVCDCNFGSSVRAAYAARRVRAAIGLWPRIKALFS